MTQSLTTIEDVADALFDTQELVAMLAMQNQSPDREERKAQFVRYTIALKRKDELERIIREWRIPTR